MLLASFWTWARVAAATDGRYSAAAPASLFMAASLTQGASIAPRGVWTVNDLGGMRAPHPVLFITSITFAMLRSA